MEQGHATALPWHRRGGGARTLQALAVCISRGTGENHNFCFRGEVRDGHKVIRAIAVIPEASFPFLLVT